MPCAYRESCLFFEHGVGYSPELNRSMKQRFCLKDSAGCARFIALEAIGRDDVPADLLPSDRDRLEDMGVGTPNSAELNA